MALSTLRPATSPHLSSIRLDLAGSVVVDLPVKLLVKDTGDDLRRVADEVVRIEREFEGTVNFTVVPDSVFEAVLDTLGVSFRFAALTEYRSRVDAFSLVPYRYFSVTVAETRSTVSHSIGHSAALNCLLGGEESRTRGKVREDERKRVPVFDIQGTDRSRRASRRSRRNAHPYKTNTRFIVTRPPPGQVEGFVH